MIHDWKIAIDMNFDVLNQINKLDTKHLWDYYAPNVAATEQQLVEAEEHLGFPLDLPYRKFLSHANGWRCFFLSADLFGTEELMGGPMTQEVLRLMEYGDLESLAKENIAISDLLPIGRSRAHNEDFVMLKPNSVAPGTVLWYAGYEIERYRRFDEFFLAMIDLNRANLQDEQKAHGLI